MLEPQNFTVYANNKTDITLDIDPDGDVTLVGAEIYWKVYEQSMGLPVAGEDPVIEKDNGVDGTIVVDDPDEQTLTIPLEPEDTTELLRNYYHEATVVDENLGQITVAFGIMTVVGTENRP
jgi:hypothetical protein